MASSSSSPVVNDNPQLQTYYNSLESRLGYRLVLGGTRHFGYWERDTYWPFPLSTPLRAMEDKLAEALALPPHSQVLDAGCGVGHVALRMVQAHGLRITGIDIIDHHIAKARRNVSRANLADPSSLTVQKMDYHHLEAIPSGSLDGAYTMETFVHATDPEAVLAGFFRVLKPGGRIALFEYDHELSDSSSETEKELASSMRKVNKYAAMPTNDRSHPGVFKKMLEDAGFEDVVVRDLSENIRPMARLFFMLGVIPWLFIRLFGLEKSFINTVAGVEMYRGRHRWRFVGISATKPGGPLEVGKSR
ncbi:S-adenosyl-L-methionine-dependent methyltransferase [Rhypophila sp. PSN 637]